MTLWEILKANKTGIAPDMFTMLAASKMNGGRNRLHELSGIPPLSFTAKGKPLTAWSITGNTVQNGTPTPENPVEVLGCGDYDSETGLYKIPVVTRGKNLAGNYTVSSGYYYDDPGTPTPSDARFIRLSINVEPNTIYTISSNLKFYSIWEFNNNTKISRHGGSNSNKYTIKTSKECNSLRISMINTSGKADTSAFEWIQLEKGSTATPYEPYHEPITTPIYLDSPLYKIGKYADSRGMTEEVRVVKELVLTGTDVDGEWKASTTRKGSFYLKIGTNAVAGRAICDRATNANNIDNYHYGNVFVEQTSDFLVVINLWLFDTAITLADFKAYLATQYANGTPVTVYYVLAEPEIKSITLPKIPTFDGTTVIDVDTAVKPESMTIKYRR